MPPRIPSDRYPRSTRAPRLGLAAVAASPLALLLVLSSLAFGAAAADGADAEEPEAERTHAPEPEKGRYRPPNAPHRSAVDSETYERLIGLGYLQGYSEAPAAQGVTRFDPQRAQPGVNIVVSGDSPTAAIQDLHGNVLHEWRYLSATEIWPEFEQETIGSFWRRVHVYPNGDLLAIYEYAGLVKLDAGSNLLWSHRGERHAHHDLEVLDNGLIYVLTSQHRVVPEISDRVILDEYISVLAPDGGVVVERSILDLILNSKYAHLLDRPQTRSGGFYGHVLHTNTLEVIGDAAKPGDPVFKRGNVLISLLMLDTIAVADLAKGELVWAHGHGKLSRQHDPTLLANGNILLFDNRPNDGCSRVVELDPESREEVWSYDGCADESLFSATCGTNQRLANGNTLITETDNGRALEVTPDKEIVWEYVNPERAADDGKLIASLLEVVRVDPRRYPFLRAVPHRSKDPAPATDDPH